MDEYAFVDLVTSAPTLRITHIPVMLDRTAGTYGKIHGTCLAAESAESGVRRAPDGRHRVPRPARIHLAHVVCEEGGRADVELRGGSRHGPACGASLTKTALHKLLGRLIEKFESTEGSGYDFSKLPESYVSPMLGGIVGFEMQIESLEGKFKLGQERSDADKQGLLEHLGQAKRRERSLQDLTASFYKRPQPG